MCDKAMANLDLWKATFDYQELQEKLNGLQEELSGIKRSSRYLIWNKIRIERAALYGVQKTLSFNSSHDVRIPANP
jgi:hypothetical protein